MSARRAFWSVPLVAVVGSQAGHVLAYAIRFGGNSIQMQGAGTHAYFPTVAKTGIGIAAMAVLVTMLVIGAARLVGRHRLDTQTMPSLLRLLAVLFTLQVACFAAQETAEAMLAGGRFASAPVLLLWAAAGQLPVALLGALALRWLGARFTPALATLRRSLAGSARRPALGVTPLAPISRTTAPVTVAMAPRPGSVRCSRIICAAAAPSFPTMLPISLTSRSAAASRPQIRLAMPTMSSSIGARASRE